jgi:deoxycytidylate deaminase
MNWMLYAYQQAIFSPDESSQNGAVIIDPAGKLLACSYNAPPPCTDMIQTRPEKYQVIEHAERAGIYYARADLTGATMYCPWAACCDCARGIIFSGIRRLVAHSERMDLTNSHWIDNVTKALSMLAENTVEVLFYKGPVIGAPNILVDGKLWSPEKLDFV